MLFFGTMLKICGSGKQQRKFFSLEEACICAILTFQFPLTIKTPATQLHRFVNTIHEGLLHHLS